MLSSGIDSVRGSDSVDESNRAILQTHLVCFPMQACCPISQHEKSFPVTLYLQQLRDKQALHFQWPRKSTSTTLSLAADSLAVLLPHVCSRPVPTSRLPCLKLDLTNLIILLSCPRSSILHYTADHFSTAMSPPHSLSLMVEGFPTGAVVYVSDAKHA